MPFLNFTRLDSLDNFFQDKISVERVESSKMSTLVLPINALGKNLNTRVTKFFHIDSIGTLQQCTHAIPPL